MVESSSTPVSLAKGVYGRLSERTVLGRERLGRPMTLAEKVLVNHLRDPANQPLERGLSYADFDPGPGRSPRCAGTDRGAAVHDCGPGQDRVADHRPL